MQAEGEAASRVVAGDAVLFAATVASESAAVTAQANRCTHDEADVTKHLLGIIRFEINAGFWVCAVRSREPVNEACVTAGILLWMVALVAAYVVRSTSMSSAEMTDMPFR